MEEGLGREWTDSLPYRLLCLDSPPLPAWKSLEGGCASLSTMSYSTTSGQNALNILLKGLSVEESPIDKVQLLKVTFFSSKEMDIQFIHKASENEELFAQIRKRDNFIHIVDYLSHFLCAVDSIQTRSEIDKANKNIKTTNPDLAAVIGY